jgi:cation transport regulator ChaB
LESIQELKDVAAVAKIKFLVDPNIYVDNNLSIETREFLCMLLNTFYKRYSENAEYEKEAAKNNEQIKGMLKAISNNEELLFKVQKTNINSQVQMEGELLGEKSKLKDLTQKFKDLSNEEKRVRVIWNSQKSEYDQRKKSVDELKEIMFDL